MPNDHQSTVLTVLSRHIGSNNGVSMRQLEQQLDLSPRRIRHFIDALRNDGHAICGTPKEGYYIAETPEEWQKTRDFIVSRSMHGLVWVSRVEKIALPDLLGQLRVPT